MKILVSSIHSEFYKSRKTLGFWSAILLPFILCFLVFAGFFAMPGNFDKMNGAEIWNIFSGAIIGVMGSLLLPMFIIFLAYSVNNIEHKADTWKTLFSLPTPKWCVYSAKFLYATFLLFICLMLFASLTFGLGNLLSVLNPRLKFNEYHMGLLLYEIYFKLFLACLGILSIQFLLSLLWPDFIKPMGIGFICTIVAGIITAINWTYAYLDPYAHPGLVTKSMAIHPQGAGTDVAMFDLFSKEVLVSALFTGIFFTIGFFAVQKRSVR